MDTSYYIDIDTDSSEEEKDSSSYSQDTNFTEDSSDFPYKGSKLFLIGFGYYSRPENESFLNFTIFFKKYNIDNHTLPDNIIVTVEINYSRRLRFLEERNASCSKFTEDKNNAQYNCIVKEVLYKNISKLAIPNNKKDLGQYNFNLIYSSYANKTMKDIQAQKGGDLKDINILNNAKRKIIYEENAFSIEGNPEKYIKYNEVIFSYDRNGNGDLKNFSCDVKELTNEENKFKFTCNPQSSIKSNLDGIIGTGIEKYNNEKILINFGEYEDGNIDFYFDKNYGKMSSGGLTGGAIAGIVIACVVILIAIAIIILTCIKSPKAPIQESDIDIYNNNSDVHQNSSNNL